MTFKKIIGWLHLWLGLISGLIILIIALTGAVYEFQPEITKITQPYLSVKEENRAFLPVSVFKQIAEKQLPGKKPNRILIKEKNESVVIQFFGRNTQPYYYNIFINPYTGEVLKVKNMDYDFFGFILNGHLYLWLPRAIGHSIMIYGTLIFTIIIITGLLLWWPYSRAQRKNSFKVKWNASPKRLNYDLHNIPGFYASWVILFAVLTGLVWSFEWAAKSEYWLVARGSKKPAMPKVQSVPVAITESTNPLDKIYTTIAAAYPSAKYYQMNFPFDDSAAIVVRVYPDKGLLYNADNLYFDQYTAKQIPVSYWGIYADAGAGEKATRMNYDIHIGAIAGLPGRLLMFFAALITASLPVTGFYIWWGKRKKSSRYN